MIEFMRDCSETGQILSRIEDMLEYLFPRYLREGKSYCTVAVGCTGGKHRSVLVAGDLAKRLEKQGYKVNLIHRDMHLP